MYIVYVDLVGFTAYTQPRSETEAAEFAQSFALRAMQVARRNALRPVKTVGDAVIFVGSDARTACRGALALREEFGPSHRLGVHVGIASGTVIERDGDVFGFPVNLAAHLAGEGARGEIIIDSKTAAALPSGDFELRPIGGAGARWLAKPVERFRLLRPLRFLGAT